MHPRSPARGGEGWVQKQGRHVSVVSSEKEESLIGAIGWTDMGAAPLEPEPQRVDLRDTACSPYPPVSDQGGASSCVAHAFAAALCCARRSYSKGHHNPYPSVGAIFEGASRRSPDRTRGVSFEAVVGILKEHAAGLGCRVVTISCDAFVLRAALRQGAPVVLGYQVNAEIDLFHRSAKACVAHGYVLPSFASDTKAVAAHAVLLVGYDNRVGCFIVRNSWGRSWGVDGHCLLRYEDVENPLFATDVVRLRCVGSGRDASDAFRQPVGNSLET